MQARTTGSGFGRTLRVGVVGVRVQEARRYYVSIQVLPGSGAPAGLPGGLDSGMSTRPDLVVRTETSDACRNPEFAACSFVLRLPQPLAATPTDAPLLRLELFAAPTLESAGPLMGVGRDLDELVGSGLVACRPELAARLLRGERVPLTLPLPLPGEAPPLAAGAGGEGGAGGGSVKLPPLVIASGVGLRTGPGRGRELLLELTLLDACVTLPSDAFAARSLAAGAGPVALASLPGTPSGGSPARSSQRECSLLVLVSRAENLPLVMGDGGVEAEPDTFVAAKSLRDAAGSQAAQAVTRVAIRSCRPAWHQLLRLRYAEADLPREHLLLAIVNGANNRLMIKAALPLAPLVPDKHYNLRLALPGGPLGSAVHLYVTLVLTDCATAQQRHLRNHMAVAKQLLQARLASVSGRLTPPGEAADAPDGHCFSVWRLANAAASSLPLDEAPQLPEPDPYTTLDTTSEAAVAAALHAMADRHAAAVKASADASASCTEVLPLQAEGGEQQLWPPDHMVSLLAAAGDNPVLQLGLYHVPPHSPSPAAVAAASAPAAAPPLSQEERLMGRAPGAPVAAPAEGPPAATGSAEGGQAREQRPARLLGWASVPLRPRPADGLGPGEVQLLEGVALKMGSTATVDATADAGKSAGPGARPDPAGLTVSLEVRQRDTAAVVATLESEAQRRPHGEAAGEAASSPSAGAGSTTPSRTGEAAPAAGPGGDGSGAAAGAALEVLVETCLLLQGALGRLIRQLDAAAAQAEVASWRVADAENRCRTIAGDNNKLRQLFHEEKQACRSPPLLLDSSTLSRDELIVRCEAAMAAYGRERRRNAELVHRLQQMHVEQVDTLELKKRYQQLQEAHMEQARAYADIEKQGRRNGQLQATLKTQEEIIRNLEGLLAQAVETAKSEGAAGRSIRAEHERLLAAAQQLEEHAKAQEARIPELESQLAAAQRQLVAQEAELEVLRQHTTTEYRADGTSGEPTRGGGGGGSGGGGAPGEPGPDYQRLKQLEELLAAARERNKELEAGMASKQAAEENLKRLETDVAKLVEEKTAALLRAEYAEGAAAAAQEELIEVTKKSARDIAELKTRLAEKDALLMGGFGDLDQLRRGEAPHPPDLGAFDVSRLGTPPGMAPLRGSHTPGHIPGHPPEHTLGQWAGRVPSPPQQQQWAFQRQLSHQRASAGASAGGQEFGLGNGANPAGLGQGPGPGLGSSPRHAPAARVRSAEGHGRGALGGTPPPALAGASPTLGARPASQGAAPSQPPAPLLPPINTPSGGGADASSASPQADSASPPGRAKPARTRLGRRPPSPPEQAPAPPPPPPPEPVALPPASPPPAQATPGTGDGGQGKTDANPPAQEADDAQAAPEGAGGRRAPRVPRRRK